MFEEKNDLNSNMCNEVADDGDITCGCNKIIDNKTEPQNFYNIAVESSGLLALLRKNIARFIFHNKCRPMFWISITIIALFIVIIVLACFIFGDTPTNFNEVCSEINLHVDDNDIVSLEIASDGTWMSFDSNKYDKEGWDSLILYENDIREINKKLGFPSSLYKKMITTTWSQGRQIESNKNYTVSWTYHSEKGLEILYEMN